MLVGATIEGGVVSRTVTLQVAVAVLAEKSVALQDTGTEPSTRSSAVAEYVTIAPAGLVASAVISAGRVKAGGVVSRTVTVEDAEPVLPNPSVAVHVTVVTPMGKVEPEGGEQVVERETPVKL